MVAHIVNVPNATGIVHFKVANFVLYIFTTIKKINDVVYQKLSNCTI